MKNLLIGLLALGSISAFADTVVVKKSGVLIPADLGKAFICDTKLGFYEAIMGYHSDKGVICLSSSLAGESVGSISCNNKKQFTLINVDGEDEEGNKVKKVFAVNATDLLME
jgi:hypothetical protein